MLTHPTKILAIVLLLWTHTDILAAAAERPIEGGLGITLGKELPSSSFGAEIAHIPHQIKTTNLEFEEHQNIPGAALPWHYLTQLNPPKLLRALPYESYVMLNDDRETMHVHTQFITQKCDREFDWLKKTLTKKYKVKGDAEVQPPEGAHRSLRISFLSKQVDVHCGERLIVDYLDTDLIKAWYQQREQQAIAYASHTESFANTRALIERRKTLKFADTFTLGDRFRMDGAFGVQFQTPFAKNSKQQFPVDQPFYAGLPNLPEPFDEGEIQLVISPEKHPISIRGKFENLDFEKIAASLKEKYGNPSKNTPRHVIHKVGNNRVIMKKLSESTTELAFIDTHAQAEQKRRLWEQESDGL